MEVKPTDWLGGGLITFKLLIGKTLFQWPFLYPLSRYCWEQMSVFLPITGCCCLSSVQKTLGFEVCMSVKPSWGQGGESSRQYPPCHHCKGGTGLRTTLNSAQQSWHQHGVDRSPIALHRTPIISRDWNQFSEFFFLIEHKNCSLSRYSQAAMCFL